MRERRENPPFFLFFLPLAALFPLLMFGGFGRKKPSEERRQPQRDPNFQCRDITRIPDERVAVYLQKPDEFKREFGDPFTARTLRWRCWHEYMSLRSQILQSASGGDPGERLREAEVRFRACEDRARVAEERWREISALRTAIIRDCLQRVTTAAQM